MHPAGMITSVKEVLCYITLGAKLPGKLKVSVLPIKWETHETFWD